MSFVIPELVIESIIRDGIANLVKNPDIISNVFESLKANYNSRKYGQKEINKIKELILKHQIPVVHNLSDVGAHKQSFSIQVGLDTEAKSRSMLGDFSDAIEEPFTDPEDIAGVTILDALIVTAYDSISGKITVQSGTDLSNVASKHIYVDAEGIEFDMGSVIKTGADAGFFIDKGQDPDFSDFGAIHSTIDFKRFEERTVVSDEQIIIGVHSKDALTTKYLYILLKYFLVSRKEDLIKRCFVASSFSGSDFTRNMKYQGDHSYNRFMTVSGQIDDVWRADEVIPGDDVEIQILVPQDEAPASDTSSDNSTVKPGNFQC